MFKDMLFSMQDTKYAKFTQNLIPNLEKERIIGVRKPTLHKLAKDLCKNKPDEVKAFLKDLPHTYLEENLLHCYLLELTNNFKDLEAFIPHMDNWAITDAFSKKYMNTFKDDIYTLSMKYLVSDKTYEIRFAIVILLTLEMFDYDNISKVCSVKSDEYYVNMAIAWYMSIALVKNYDIAVKFIQDKNLDTWVHNKSIQKAIESLRIDDKTKKYLKGLKKNVFSV